MQNRKFALLNFPRARFTFRACARRRATFSGVLLVCFSKDANAHFFGTIYSLPIPFWLYAYGAAAALVVSFVLVGYFVSAGAADQNFSVIDVSCNNKLVRTLTKRKVLIFIQALSLFALLLTIVTGLVGSSSSLNNFSMTWFWIGFALGFTYITALVGDLFAYINPWRVLCAFSAWIGLANFNEERIPFPRSVAYWPGVGLYIAYIWIELFAQTEPYSLAVILLVYTAITLLGAWLFSAQKWFQYGEFFGIFLRLVAKMAPLQYGRGRRVWLRQPFIGLIDNRAEHPSFVIFVLFMLSSTAYDGAHETIPWVTLFWNHIYPVFEPVVKALSRHPYAASTDLFYGWQWLALIASPFIYWIIYILFITSGKLITRSNRPIRELSLTFAFTLIPIAFVYNLSHYYTLLITQGPLLLPLLSDPFGYGWNLFGTAGLISSPFIPDAGFVWHSQVCVILAGHIVAVYLSHLQALKVFPNNRVAVIGQLPMLCLMVLFTTAGLWILSLPIVSGQALQPLALPSG